MAMTHDEKARRIAHVEKLAEEWVNRAVAVYAGDRPCNVKKYRTVFLTALRALGEATR